MSMRTGLVLASLLFCFSDAAATQTCRSIDPPRSWSAQEAASPTTGALDNSGIPALDLVVFRHGEKPLRNDGVMIEDGNLGAGAENRIMRLPEKFLQEFGCPDLLVTTNPAVKMINKTSGQYFNYVRPLATIAPLSIKLNFPVWTPYGYNQSDRLARDFLADPALRHKANGAPVTVFIAWERQNIPKLYRELVEQGKLTDLAGKTAPIDGASVQCEILPPWEQCNFDSIWLIRVRPVGVCLTRRAENLNTASFQEKCTGAESVSDAPR